MKNVNLSKTAGLLNPDSSINYKEIMDNDNLILFPIIQTPHNNDSYLWTLSDLTCLLPEEEKSTQLYFSIEQETNGTKKYMYTTLDDFGDIAYFEPDEDEMIDIEEILNRWELFKNGYGVRNILTPNNKVLDTINLDMSSFENTAIIPFISSRAEATFKWLYEDEKDIDFMQYDVLYLVIKPIAGDIYSFDGQYQYYVVSSTQLSLTEDIALAGKEITGSMTEDEKKYILNILWGCSSSTYKYFHLAEKAIGIKYPNIQFKRFANDIGYDYCNGCWHGVWLVDDGRILTATTRDMKLNHTVFEPEFEFNLVG